MNRKRNKFYIKKILCFILSLSILTSCVTLDVNPIPNSTSLMMLDKDRIEILGEAEGNAGGARLWLLFIPFGWARDKWLKSRATKNALKSYPNADGLLDATLDYHRVRVPLVFLTVVTKDVKVKGVAYHIRTDEEYKEFKKKKESENE
ncbi:MAG: hypothetical protein U0L67_06475 [Paludibacteraceae bacterium]|nr:hypothetical protein [Paludibacteraceae bacterium]MEE0912080.1 hypothetical protein [Paludibacteraceae bacterium]